MIYHDSGFTLALDSLLARIIDPLSSKPKKDLQKVWERPQNRNPVKVQCLPQNGLWKMGPTSTPQESLHSLPSQNHCDVIFYHFLRRNRYPPQILKTPPIFGTNLQKSLWKVRFKDLARYPALIRHWWGDRYSNSGFQPLYLDWYHLLWKFFEINFVFCGQKRNSRNAIHQRSSYVLPTMHPRW